MRCLFLDIDGVLNCADTLHNAKRSDVVCPNLVKNLNKIIAVTGTKCVLSSSWRYMGLKRVLGEYLAPAGFKGEFIGVTPPAKMSYRPRGFEIQEWMEENTYLESTSFVILDDSPDMVHLTPYLVQTDFFEGGLLNKHVEWAIAALRGHNPQLEGPQLLHN